MIFVPTWRYHRASNKGKDKSVLISSCGLKLDGMKFDAMESTRNEELEASE